MRTAATATVLILFSLHTQGQVKKKPAPERDAPTPAERAEVVSRVRDRVERLQSSKWSDAERAAILADARKSPQNYLGWVFDDWTGFGGNGIGRLTNGYGQWETKQTERLGLVEVEPEMFPGAIRGVRKVGQGPKVRWLVKKVVSPTTAVISRQPFYPQSEGKESFYTIDLDTTGMTVDTTPDLTPIRDTLYAATGPKTVDGKPTTRLVPFTFTETEKQQFDPALVKKKPTKKK